MLDDELVKRVIAKYGPILDLEKRPQDLVDILRSIGLAADMDGGSAPGGVPEPPPVPEPPVPEPPPGPSSFQAGAIRLDDLMTQVLELTRQVAKNSKDLKKIRSKLDI